MVPGTYNIEIFKGSTWSVTLTAKDHNDADMDFTNYDGALMEIYPPWTKSGSGQSIIYTLSTVNKRITLTTTEMVLNLTAQETSNLPFNNGFYVLDLIIDATSSTAKKVDRFLTGKFTVKGVVVP